MTLDKKLSTYLNRYHSYYNIKDAESDKINDIAFEYILSAEDKIFKQPAIALRAIKVEKAIDLLLNEGGDSIKKDLTLLKQQWVNLEKDKKLGLLPDDQSRVTMAKIVQGLLYIIPE